MKREDFRLAICEAITALGSEVAVARVVRVGTPAVTGWSVGVNMPHPLMRSAIVAALCEAMKAKAEEDRRTLGVVCMGQAMLTVTDHDDSVSVELEDERYERGWLDRASVEKLHAWLGAWLERDDG